MASVEYKKLAGVGRICGDYCAFHEMSIYCEYVYGYPKTAGDILENISEEKEMEYEELEALPVKELDALISEFVQKSDSDYCDMEDQTFMVEFTDGEITGTYLSV